jgi:Acetyltransferase (GNAT) domain
MQLRTAPRWEETTYRLVYRLGEFTLFSRAFRALCLRNHFLTLSSEPEVPPPPLSRFDDGIGMIVTRSHPVSEKLPKLRRISRGFRYVPSQYSRHHAELRGTFESYLAKFSAKTRNTLRRKVKHLLAQGAGSGMRQFRKPEEMPEFHRLARMVSALTYQERLLDAGLPDDEEFLAELQGLAREDRVRGYLLFLKDDPIAYLYCPAEEGGVLLYSHLGFDPKHASFSPGTVLQYLAFETLFMQQAFHVFDFTEGEGAHKKLFATHAVQCADILYFPPGVASLLWVYLHMCLDATSALAGRALTALGIKSLVKRLLRRA